NQVEIPLDVDMEPVRSEPQTTAEMNPGSLSITDVPQDESSKELESEAEDTPHTDIPDLMEPSTSSGTRSRSTSASSKTRKSPRFVQSTKDHPAKASKKPRGNPSQAKHGKSKKRK